jgi:hypothetical protein
MIPGPLCTALAGCLCAMVFGMSTAQAAGTRIVFSGAIVEPTCGFAAAQMSAAAAVVAPRRFNCAKTLSATSAATQVYAEQVLPLAAVTPDHLLTYFAGYADNASGSGGPTAKLVTRTYE